MKSNISISVSLLVFTPKLESVIVSHDIKRDSFNLPEGNVLFGETLKEAAYYLLKDILVSKNSIRWDEIISTTISSVKNYCVADKNNSKVTSVFNFVVPCYVSEEVPLNEPYNFLKVRELSKISQEKLHFGLKDLQNQLKNGTTLNVIKGPSFDWIKKRPTSSLGQSEKERKNNSEESKNIFVPLDLVSFVICPRTDSNSRDRQVLMVEERSGRWFLPAGHVDHGESMVEGGDRETLEETGLRVNTLGLSEVVFSYSSNYSALHFVLISKEKTIDELSKNEKSKLKQVPDSESRSASYLNENEILKELNISLHSPKEIETLKRQYRKAFEIYPFLKKASTNNFSFIRIYGSNDNVYD